MLFIQNARLIPYLTERFENPIADILVDGKLIKDITPAGTKSPPESAQQIDLENRTLLPGMFDLHMHLYFSTDNFFELACRSRNQHVFDAVKSASEFLKQGFTTIRDCGNIYDIGIDIRDAIDSGIIQGPRVYSAGQCLSPYAKGNTTFPALYNEVNTREEIMKAVRHEHAKGVDFVKYMATGSVANLHGEPGELISSREEIFAVQSAAESVGTYVGVHCHGKDGIKICIEAGIRTIEHASMLDDECIELILKNGNRTAIIPTLDPVVQLHRGYQCEDTSAEILNKINQVYLHTADIVKSSRAGILTGWGTDCSLNFFSKNVGYEFDARHEVGYSNREILEQVTINSAKILGVDNVLGTIKVGKIADFVVIDGRPDEDIYDMCKYPYMVFKNGMRCF